MKKNHFVLVTQYFPPEIGGGSQRSIGFVEELIKQGVDVSVVTPFPSYLISNVKTKWKLYEKYEKEGYTLYETFVFASDRGSFLKRMIYYLSFVVSAIIVITFKLEKINYLMTVSPPLFTGIVGIVIKKIKRVKFIFDIGDLWPESAIQLGFLKNKTVINLAEKLERAIYRNADIVNLVTKRTLNKIKELHPYIKKILYVPNFVNTSKFFKIEKNSELLNKLNLDGKLIFGYAGNLGSAQGIKIITDAAERTKDNHHIMYIIIGDGVERNDIENAIKVKNLNNVLLLPPVSRDEVVKYVTLFDAMIIPLVKNELFKITIPSKLYESMAAEVPVLLCVDGEARKIVEEYKCGFYVEPENDKMLSDKIIEFSNNPELLLEFGKNGRRGAIEQFSREKVISDFYNEL